MNKSEALVRWVLARGVWLWAIALLAFVPAAVHTGKLYAGLRSEFDRLLPRDAPSVVALDELRGRLEGLHHLGVVVEADDAARLPAAERFVDDLRARVAAYPPGLVRTVRTGQQEERTFLEGHAALYADLADLRTVRERIEARRAWEVTHAVGADVDDDPAPSVNFDDIKQKYEEKNAGAKRFPDGRFTSSEQRVTLLLIEVGPEHNAGRELLARVKADMASLGGPARYAPGLRAGFSGEVAISVEETEALMADLSVSSLLVLLAVTVVLQGYFRWRAATPVLLAPLLIATALSFALASFPPFNVHELNSNTAFLASIIIGNGINPGIILLARYLEERRRGRDPRAALVEAVPASAPGTIVAALAAASSYAALALTQFQGFRQFGFLGGLGMVLAWTMTYLLLPPLLLWVDRGAALPSAGGAGFLDPLARLIGRRAPVIAVVGGMLTLAAIVPVRHFSLDSVETDFSRLRRADTWKNGEGYWGGRMNAMLGEYLTPLVVLTDSPEAARQAAVNVRQLATGTEYGPLIAKVRTIDDVAPAEQAEKVVEASKIRALLAKMRSKMTDDQRKLVDRFVGDRDPQVLTVDQLPRSFTTGLRERDGHVDRMVLVFPRPSRDMWQGPRLLGFVNALRAAAADRTPDARAPRLAGGLPVSADIVASVEHDGPRVTLAAFVGAVVVVLALFRMRAATWQVLGALLLGVLWMTGLALGLGVKINFCNFIAFPITFGIGVEYAANVLNRYEVEGRRDILAAVRSTGAAVAVCSSTTIIGYSSLLVADNRALFLFGLLAVLGEVTCIVAALVVLPALMRLGRPPAESSDVLPGAGVAP